MSNENKHGKIRQFIVRRQMRVFLAMIIVGIGLLLTSLVSEHDTFAQGIAFIIVGFVGVLMSWTTYDIGNEIKEEIRTVGKDVRTVGKKVDAMNSTLIEIRDILKGKN